MYLRSSKRRCLSSKKFARLNNSYDTSQRASMIFSTMHESESPAVDQVPVKNKYCLNRRNIQKYIQKKKSTFFGPLFVTSKESRTKSRKVSDKFHESR